MITRFCLVGGHTVADEARLVRATKASGTWQPDESSNASIWVCSTCDTGLWADAPDSGPRRAPRDFHGGFRW